MTRAPDTTAPWIRPPVIPAFPRLDRHLVVDAVVVGGGLTGVTTAYLLKAAGLTVALIERGRTGLGETAHTSAHLTAAVDRTLPDLLESFGRETAAAVWDAGYAALAEIARLIRHEQIECGFRWTPAFLTERLDAPEPGDLRRLRAVADDALRAGFDAELVDAVPGLGRAGVRLDGQASFHPLQYVGALVALVPGGGSHVFEGSPVDAVHDDPLTVSVGPWHVSTGFVVIATHVPIAGKTGLMRAAQLQADLYPYSTYVLGAQVEPGQWPDALIWDLADPYHYVRLDRRAADSDYIIFGGEDHKTGQIDDTREPFSRLETLLKSLLPGAVVTDRWSGQVIETRDGLPYIGEVSPGQYVITGFGGNGLTFGTLGAMMARDAITGRSNRWAALFDSSRTRVTEGLWRYLKENKDFPYYLLRDRFGSAGEASLATLASGEGRLVELHGRLAAAYRSPVFGFSLLSPTCPHLVCHVAWNAAESTWDCPCHGSRFSASGDLIAGPAERGLAAFEGD